MQEPTRLPSDPETWTKGELVPTRPRRGWLRGLVIVALAALGLAVGGMIGSSFVLVDMALGTVLMLVGMWLGLAGGIWFGVWVTRARPPVDPARYPNRIVTRAR